MQFAACKNKSRTDRSKFARDLIVHSSKTQIDSQTVITLHNFDLAHFFPLFCKYISLINNPKIVPILTFSVCNTDIRALCVMPDLHNPII